MTNEDRTEVRLDWIGCYPPRTEAIVLERWTKSWLTWKTNYPTRRNMPGGTMIKA